MPRTPSPKNLRVPRTRLPPVTTSSQSPPPFLSTPPGLQRQGCAPGGGGEQTPLHLQRVLPEPLDSFPGGERGRVALRSYPPTSH